MNVPASLLALSLVLAASPRVGAQEGIEVEELPEPAPAGAAATVDEPAASGSPADATVTVEGEAHAVRLYAEGDLRGAQRAYADLARKTHDPATRGRLGLTAAWLAWQAEDRVAALDLLEETLTAAPQAELDRRLYTNAFVDAYRDALRVALHSRAVRASDLVNLAVEELRANELALARRHLEESLALVPDDPDALYNLALLELRSGDDQAALDGFDRVVSLAHSDPEAVPPPLRAQALNNAAVVYFRRGAFGDAANTLADAVRLDPDDARAWFNLGIARQRSGDAAGGLDALTRARRLAPDDVETTRALAIAELDRRGFAAATALLDEAVRARPEVAELRLLLGRARAGTGDDSGALEAFRAAVELDADPASTHGVQAALLWAETAHRTGRSDELARAATALIARRPEDASGWLYRGLAELLDGDATTAVGSLRKARELAPGRADLAHNLGSALMAAGDYAAAEQVFREALDLDPTNQATRTALDSLVRRREAAESGKRRRRP